MGKNNRKESTNSESEEAQALEVFKITTDLRVAGMATSELAAENDFQRKIATAMASDDKAIVVTIFDTRGGVETIPLPLAQNAEKLTLVFEKVPAAKESIEPTIEPIFYEKFKRLVAQANFDKSRVDEGVEAKDVTRN